MREDPSFQKYSNGARRGQRTDDGNPASPRAIGARRSQCSFPSHRDGAALCRLRNEDAMDGYRYQKHGATR
jgi:hypothetical protein